MGTPEFDTAPMPSDRATLARSLSLRVLRTPSVAGPTCATLAWPQHGAALASPLHCMPSFPCALVGSWFFALVPVPDPPAFLFFPTQAHTGSAPWRCCSPPHVPLEIPLHAAFVPSALHHHLRPPDYKCHLVCLSSIPPPDLK
jgi:hypothetical protein